MTWIGDAAREIGEHYASRKLGDPLTEIDGELYSGETVQLDGRHFTNCEFREGALIWEGGEFNLAPSCTFSRCIAHPPALYEILKLVGYKGILRGE